jgi:hypothetical protein
VVVVVGDRLAQSGGFFGRVCGDSCDYRLCSSNAQNKLWRVVSRFVKNVRKNFKFSFYSEGQVVVLGAPMLLRALALSETFLVRVVFPVPALLFVAVSLAQGMGNSFVLFVLIHNFV